VAPQDGGRRGPECFDVEFAFDLEDELHGVDVRRVGVELGVEEEPLLQRRQRQHVLDT
jgi:hypothetical protein